MCAVSRAMCAVSRDLLVVTRAVKENKAEPRIKIVSAAQKANIPHSRHRLESLNVRNYHISLTPKRFVIIAHIVLFYEYYALLFGYRLDTSLELHSS